MTEVGFYHLTSTPLERALPRLLERALAEGHRIVVMAGSDERVAALDAALWSYSDASFLPHGTAEGGNAARQPVLLTTADENPNAATMLVLVDGAASARWRAASAAGHAMAYWQQTSAGWEKRASG